MISIRSIISSRRDSPPHRRISDNEQQDYTADRAHRPPSSGHSCDRPLCDQDTMKIEDQRLVNVFIDQSVIHLKGIKFRPEHFITDVSGKYPRLWALKGANPIDVNRWYKFGALASIRTIAPGF
ncbi:hypothetical protein ACS0TY_002458 [Phlomoides rotata]